MRPELELIFEISPITEALYLSGHHAVREASEELVEEMGITCIINISMDLENVEFSNIDMEYVKIPVEDYEWENLSKYFDQCTDVIERVRLSGGQTLVHCRMGVSRSASVCLAYLTRYQNMTLREAYEHVYECRNIIYPNYGFWEQLINYEYRVRGYCSVEMVPINSVFMPDVYAEQYFSRTVDVDDNDSIFGIVLIIFLLFFRDILCLTYSHVGQISPWQHLFGR